MRYGAAAGAVWLILFLCSAVHGAPLETYGRLPALKDVAISPNGQEIAYFKGADADHYVIIQSLTDGSTLGGAKTGDAKVRDLTWADNDHLLITYSQTKMANFVMGPRQEWLLTDCYDVPKKAQWELMRDAKDLQAMNVSLAPPQARVVAGRTLAYVHGLYFPNGEGVVGLFTVDLAAHQGGSSEPVEASLLASPIKKVEGLSPDTQDWLIDDQGTAVVQEDYSPHAHHWSLRVKRKGGWPEAWGVDTLIDRPDIIGFTPDGASLLVQVRTEAKYENKLVSLADGSVTNAKGELEPAGSFLIDPATSRVVARDNEGMNGVYTFFDPKDAAAWNAVVQAYGGENVEFVAWSQNHRKIVVLVSGPRHGDSYQLVDLDAARALTVGAAYVGVGPGDVSPVSTIAYKAADGLEIPAYLTLPKDKEAKNLPLVVLPHGGPESRDEPGFDWWGQALASRGYAVLQPQFRGSAGFGSQHLSAGFGQWGRKMQTDLSDGVRALAAKGIIDPKRVCIVGGSYGGYAALAGAALDRGVYRCAVAVAGLSDLRAMLAWERDRANTSDTITMRYWDRFMGANGPDDPTLDQISPVKFVDKVDVPILLIHGRDDTVVPISQSQAMADALKAAGKPFTFVELESEDHWLSRSETRLQMLKASIDFLEANNPS